MPTYTFDPALAASTGDEMAAVTTRITQQLADLDSQVRSNLAEWEEAAKDEYARAKQNWDTAAQRMHMHLAKANQALGTIGQGYADVSRRGVSTWSGFSVR